MRDGPRSVGLGSELGLGSCQACFGAGLVPWPSLVPRDAPSGYSPRERPYQHDDRDLQVRAYLESAVPFLYSCLTPHEPLPFRKSFM